MSMCAHVQSAKLHWEARDLLVVVILLLVNMIIATTVRIVATSSMTNLISTNIFVFFGVPISLN